MAGSSLLILFHLPRKSVSKWKSGPEALETGAVWALVLSQVLGKRLCVIQTCEVLSAQVMDQKHSGKRINLAIFNFVL